MIKRQMARVMGMTLNGVKLSPQFEGKSGFIFDEVEQRLAVGDYSFGSEISNSDLVKEFSASRAPVTMALNLLQAAGYLAIKPQVGVRVSSPTDEEIIYYFQMHAKSESIQAFLAAQRCTPEMVTILVLILDKLEDMRDRSHSLRDQLALGGLFHSQIRLMAGMQWFSRQTVSAWRMSNFLIANRSSKKLSAPKPDENRLRREIIASIQENFPARAAELMEEFVTCRCALDRSGTYS
jgi:DNA-binding GntR family transcriptional regulator